VGKPAVQEIERAGVCHRCACEYNECMCLHLTNTLSSPARKLVSRMQCRLFIIYVCMYDVCMYVYMFIKLCWHNKEERHVGRQTIHRNKQLLQSID